MTFFLFLWAAWAGGFFVAILLSDHPRSEPTVWANAAGAWSLFPLAPLIIIAGSFTAGPKEGWEVFVDFFHALTFDVFDR